MTKELELVDGVVTPASAEHGQFTAMATLTATFGGETIPAANHFEISGNITDFKTAISYSALQWNSNPLALKMRQHSPAIVSVDFMAPPQAQVGHGVGSSSATQPPPLLRRQERLVPQWPKERRFNHPVLLASSMPISPLHMLLARLERRDKNLTEKGNK